MRIVLLLVPLAYTRGLNQNQEMSTDGIFLNGIVDIKPLAFQNSTYLDHRKRVAFKFGIFDHSLK